MYLHTAVQRCHVIRPRQDALLPPSLSLLRRTISLLDVPGSVRLHGAQGHERDKKQGENGIYKNNVIRWDVEL